MTDLDAIRELEAERDALIGWLKIIAITPRNEIILHDLARQAVQEVEGCQLNEK